MQDVGNLVVVCCLYNLLVLVILLFCSSLYCLLKTFFEKKGHSIDEHKEIKNERWNLFSNIRGIFSDSM